MTILFYYASGSPYAWRVRFALERKALSFELKSMTFSSGDLGKPEYKALNPRSKIPVIVDGNYSLYESAAIVEYLEDAYPLSGEPLFPAEPRPRGTVRRLIREADEYLAHALEGMVTEVLFKPQADWNAAAIAQGRAAFVGELAYFDSRLDGDFMMGAVGAADFTIYPMIALALRMELKKPDLGIRDSIGPKLAAWMKRIEALPYYARTYPPHWK